MQQKRRSGNGKIVETQKVDLRTQTKKLGAKAKASRK